MSMTRIHNIQHVLEAKTRRWWFFVGIILLQLIPPYASKGFSVPEWGNIIGYTLSKAWVHSLESAFPIFHAIPYVLILCVVLLKNRIARIFSICVGLSYVFFAIVQDIAVTPKYGLSIVTVNVLMFLLVAAAWFWEGIALKNEFSSGKQSVWKYLLIAPAFLALWYPAKNGHTPDFSLIHMLTGPSGVAFCLMTPVYLTVLVFCYPQVNMVTLRVTGVVGTILGLYNVVPTVIVWSDTAWWNGILHLPLLLISLLAVVLSMRTQREHKRDMTSA